MRRERLVTFDDMKRAAGAIFTCALIVGMFSDAASAQAESDRPLVLVPHRAIYDLSLKETRGNSSIAGVRGRILYDFGGSACDGYSLTFRQVSELNSSEGKESTSDLRSTTWEGADAKRFKFTTQNFVDGNLVNAVDGHADHGGKVTAIDLHRPDHKSLDLGGRLVFPTEHMVRAIEAARTGKTILSFPVYDGSENGEKVFNTLTVIGKKIAPGERNHDDAAAHEAKARRCAALAGDDQLFCQGQERSNRRAEARLCDRFRTLRQRHLARADARLQRFHRQREIGVARYQDAKALQVKRSLISSLPADRTPVP